RLNAPTRGNHLPQPVARHRTATPLPRPPAAVRTAARPRGRRRRTLCGETQSDPSGTGAAGTGRKTHPGHPRTGTPCPHPPPPPRTRQTRDNTETSPPGSAPPPLVPAPGPATPVETTHHEETRGRHPHRSRHGRPRRVLPRLAVDTPRDPAAPRQQHRPLRVR